MTTLKFADTHNMVPFLDKPAKSEGFEQIVDFLKAHIIKYALTINPTVYTSCIEQLWAIVKAKTVNGEVQLQALVDGKKIIITESIVASHEFSVTHYLDIWIIRTQGVGAGTTFSRGNEPDPIELEDHAPMYIPEPEHPEDLVPADEMRPSYNLYYPHSFIFYSPPPPTYLDRPWLRLSYSTIHLTSILQQGPHHATTIPLPLHHPLAESLSYSQADIRPHEEGYYLLSPRPIVIPGCEVGESSAAAAARQPGPTMARRVDCSSVDTVDVRSKESSEFYSRHHDAQKDHAAVRAEIEVLRRERLAYEQESMETRQALARSEAYSRALEAWITVLETQARRHKWQRQDADDRTTRHIMRIQALEVGARDDTLDDTGSSS
ncbi:hypothetical protein Tco_0379503 [Tanacetum coccineum]